jgi:D-beta-D-heptose 7-phosphate kinase / D-beta-D-heptose 1-phosphate adenosyltransferase
MSDHLIKIVKNQFLKSKKTCLVIGDLMLDQYIFGDVDRISPEAPVPVIKKNKHHNRIGGAGNVALNLLGLGIKPLLVGNIGNDANGQILSNLIKKHNLSIKGLIKEKGPTTTKTRVMADHHQIARIDEEQISYGPNEANIKKIIKYINSNLSCIVISDYNKGFLSTSFLKKIIQQANRKKIPVLIDPKGKDVAKYGGATLITPNKKEAMELTGLTNFDNDLVNTALKKISKNYKIKSIVMTQGEDGIRHITQKKINTYPAAISKQIYDVSGAGDTVIATLATCIMEKLDLSDCFKLANLAAGIVISKLGTVPINGGELLDELESNFNGQKNKIFSLNELLPKITDLTAKGQTIGFTNGCFDILHSGHVTYLEKAKSQVDYLILGLNSDSSVKTIKGKNRPIIGQTDRARVLCALESIDAVIIFNESTPIKLIEAIQPDVLIKGNDYTPKSVVGAKEIKKWKGKLYLVPLLEGKSSSKIIKKMK